MLRVDHRYKWLDGRYVGTASKIVVKKLLLDQFVMTPPLYVIFYVTMSFMEGKADLLAECRQKFLPTFWVSPHNFSHAVIKVHQITRDLLSYFSLVVLSGSLLRHSILCSFHLLHVLSTSGAVPLLGSTFSATSKGCLRKPIKFKMQSKNYNKSISSI